MVKVHEIRNGTVVNTYVVGDISDYPEGLLVEALKGGVGWRVVDGELLPPVPPVTESPSPQIISRFQLQAALLKAGLLDAVLAWSQAAATDPLHRLAFETKSEFRRDDAVLIAAATALAWPNTQGGDLFTAAGEIQE